VLAVDFLGKRDPQTKIQPHIFVFLDLDVGLQFGDCILQLLLSVAGFHSHPKFSYLIFQLKKSYSISIFLRPKILVLLLQPLNTRKRLIIIAARNLFLQFFDLVNAPVFLQMLAFVDMKWLTLRLAH
jgi:hypothetical protein